MKLKELKEILNNLTEQELEGKLITKGQYTSSCVEKVEKSKSNLYYLEDDDPSELIPESEMKIRVEEEGDEWGDFDENPYIKKGELLLIL